MVMVTGLAGASRSTTTVLKIVSGLGCSALGLADASVFAGSSVFVSSNGPF
jgi:hypothetical protein